MTPILDGTELHRHTRSQVIDYVADSLVLLWQGNGGVMPAVSVAVHVVPKPGAEFTAALAPTPKEMITAFRGYCQSVGTLYKSAESVGVANALREYEALVDEFPHAAAAAASIAADIPGPEEKGVCITVAQVEEAARSYPKQVLHNCHTCGKTAHQQCAGGCKQVCFCSISSTLFSDSLMAQNGGTVYYCSSICQRQHWPVHKRECIRRRVAK